MHIAQARVSAIQYISTTGACDVKPPTGGCDAGGCVTDRDAGLSYLYRVKGHARGQCTVTVTFSDNGPPQIQTYNFVAGPGNYCCESICAEGGGIWVLE